jgi:hypothetical protein
MSPTALAGTTRDGLLAKVLNNVALTPAEAAYCYLASLPKGTPAAVAGARFSSEGVVLIPLRDKGHLLECAWLMAAAPGQRGGAVKVTVLSLLSGRFKIAAAGPGWDGTFPDFAVRH